MNKRVLKSSIFVAGVGVGCVLTGRYFKKKYEDLVQEEVDSVRDAFSKRVKNQGDAEVIEEKSTGGAVIDYASIVKKCCYDGDEAVTNQEPTENETYVITPDEFGEYAEYEKISLTYYADGVLADENNEIVDDIDDVVGVDSLSHFGEYEEDSVFVRNDRTQVYYEILMDQRPFADVVWERPHQMEER